MESGSYWTRLARTRLSRRRLLAGAAAAGTGLAAIPLASCGGGGGEEAKPSPEASASPAAGALEPVTTRGGTRRFFSWELLPLDTLDPHQTQFGPIFDVHASVFSKVLQYADVYNGVIEPDLAEAMPEQPDELTYIIRLAPNITFHDTPQVRENLRDIAPEVPGRQLTAEDVKYSIERQLNEQSPKSALFYRSSQWETVDTIEVTDPLTLRITTKRPTAPFIHFLADSNAFIIARELVDPETDEMNAVERMVGTGPFILQEFTALQISRAIRNPNWFAKDRRADQGLPDRPIIDGYEAQWIPADITAREVAFRSKQVDGMVADDPTTVERVARETGTEIRSYLRSELVTSRLLVDDSPNATTPFKDVRLRKAIHLAVDRNRMNQQMMASGGYVCGPVPQAIARWAFTSEELARKPGYRFGTAEREEDLREAQRLWQAGGGDAVGTVTMVYAGVPEFIQTYFPQLQATLKEALGLDIEGELDPTGYTRLAQGILEKSIVITFGYDNGYNELDDFIYPYFHTNGPKNSFMLADPELDRMLEAQREEIDYEARKALGLEIQDYLLENTLAWIIWVSNISNGVDWGYVNNDPMAPWFGNAFRRADEWLDQNHPDWQGRPA
jgi:peptide/nickel transport system substrate-binding protein